MDEKGGEKCAAERKNRTKVFGKKKNFFVKKPIEKLDESNQTEDSQDKVDDEDDDGDDGKDDDDDDEDDEDDAMISFVICKKRLAVFCNLNTVPVRSNFSRTAELSDDDEAEAEETEQQEENDDEEEKANTDEPSTPRGEVSLLGVCFSCSLLFRRRFANAEPRRAVDLRKCHPLLPPKDCRRPKDVLLCCEHLFLQFFLF